MTQKDTESLIGPESLVVRSGRALGSPLRLTIAGSSPEADRAWAIVERVFDDVDVAMSRFREDSALTALNRRSPNALVDVPRLLVSALVAADRATRLTDGAFDPRIVAALERIGYVGVSQRSLEAAAESADRASGPGSGLTARPGPTPGPDRAPGPGRVLDRVGRRGPVALPVPVDLGGIGKGLALRWSARALRRDAQDRAAAQAGFLLDAGGDLVAHGAPAPGEAWAVGIESPGNAGSPVAVVQIASDGAVATSSIDRLRWEIEGRTVHHLIDPGTGEPGGVGLNSVTVAAADPAWAEVWTKALFLEGSGGIARAARRLDLAVWWMTTDGILEMTPAARQRTTWVATEA